MKPPPIAGDAFRRCLLFTVIVATVFQLAILAYLLATLPNIT